MLAGKPYRFIEQIRTLLKIYYINLLTHQELQGCA